MAFYFRTDRDFNIFNLASNVVPTNGISIYIAGTPGSDRMYSEENRLEVYFDGVFHKRFQVLEIEDSDGGTRNGGDLSCSVATTGTSMIYTLNPIKIPNDAQTMLLKAWVFRSNEIQTYEQLFTFNILPEISGSDSDLGVKNSSFTVDFSVDDANSSDILSVVGYLNDEVIYNGNDLQRGKTYSVDITNAMLSGLEIGKRNEIMFEVSDTKATVRRIYSFTKERDLETYCEYVTEPIMTASKPNCITVAQGIKCSGGVDVKVYVTNNALDNNPSWEDMTAEFNRGSVHYFTNRVCNSDRWSIALRFVNAKVDSNTEMTVSGFGFITDVIVIVDDGLPRQLSGFKSDYTFGNTHTLTWLNPEKNFTATKIVRAKNWTPLTVNDGDVIYDGVNTSITDTVEPFDDTYFDPDVYWNMIENKQYDYWTRVALNKPEGKSVDGDTYVYRKFPYGDGGVQKQEYNGVTSIVCRGEEYPYPVNSVTVDKMFSEKHSNMYVAINGYIPGNAVSVECRKDNGAEVIRAKHISNSNIVEVSAIRPGMSSVKIYTGVNSANTSVDIMVCDRLQLEVHTIPLVVYGGEKYLISYKITNSLNENLTDKCLLHYCSSDKMIHEDFTINILGGGNAEIVYNKDRSSSEILNQYHFWAEIDGEKHEKEANIYLRSYGIRG